MGKINNYRAQNSEKKSKVIIFTDKQMLELEDDISKKMEPIEEEAKIVEHESYMQGKKEFVL